MTLKRLTAARATAGSVTPPPNEGHSFGNREIHLGIGLRRGTGADPVLTFDRPFTGRVIVQLLPRPVSPSPHAPCVRLSWPFVGQSHKLDP